jgi:CubicO group peptidase (beta-lactamase class C family)
MLKVMSALVFVALLAQATPSPVFTDPDRRAKIQSALPAIERLFERYHRERQTPALAYGVIVDGELVAAKAFGVASKETQRAATPETRFRIASMTKSFTALAILKLRDEGKLSLEDLVSRWIPEMRNWRGPTQDAEPLRVRHLLTHGAGFPEDNPWGDQQLGITDEELNAWLKKGVPFSTAPGSTFEYSNYGFALLGRIVQNVSQRPYRQYLEREILKPLGMANSTLEPGDAPKDLTAVGYRRNGSPEASLRHGAFGAMGGLVTTTRDLARYVAFQLDAYPPRDGADSGPVKRSSRREMQSLWRYSGTMAMDRQIRSVGYGYGLGITHDCAFGHVVSHGGGLPGFGSNMTWLPEHGIGILSMTNLTYAGPGRVALDAFEELRKAGALQRRAWPVSSHLARTQTVLSELYQQWDDAKAERMAAMNLFLDQPAKERRAEIERLVAQTGVQCRPEGPLQAENWLRGRFRLQCEKGGVEVDFTLAPTNPPAVQQLGFTLAMPLSAEMQALAEANRGACRLGDVVSGDGKSQAVVELQCERGLMHLHLNGSRATVRRTGPDACLP